MTEQEQREDKEDAEVVDKMMMGLSKRFVPDKRNPPSAMELYNKAIGNGAKKMTFGQQQKKKQVSSGPVYVKETVSDEARDKQGNGRGASDRKSSRHRKKQVTSDLVFVTKPKVGGSCSSEPPEKVDVADKTPEPSAIFRLDKSEDPSATEKNEKAFSEDRTTNSSAVKEIRTALTDELTKGPPTFS